MANTTKQNTSSPDEGAPDIPYHDNSAQDQQSPSSRSYGAWPSQSSVTYRRPSQSYGAWLSSSQVVASFLPQVQQNHPYGSSQVQPGHPFSSQGQQNYPNVSPQEPKDVGPELQTLRDRNTKLLKHSSMLEKQSSMLTKNNNKTMEEMEGHVNSTLEELVEKRKAMSESPEEPSPKRPRTRGRTPSQPHNIPPSQSAHHAYPPTALDLEIETPIEELDKILDEKLDKIIDEKLDKMLDEKLNKKLKETPERFEWNLKPHEEPDKRLDEKLDKILDEKLDKMLDEKLNKKLKEMGNGSFPFEWNLKPDEEQDETPDEGQNEPPGADQDDSDLALSSDDSDEALNEYTDGPFRRKL